MTSLADVFVTGRIDTSRYGPDIKSGMASSSVRSAGQESGKTVGGHFKSGFGSALRGFAAPITAALGAVAVGSFFKGALDEARDAQKVGAQTAAVLKSTGGVAGVTSKQIQSLATAISNKVGVDDEAIQSGENLLLTFKNIRNETGAGNQIFNRATQAITDLSAGMGQSLKSSAVQVGKALNDPIKGVTALARVGVTFTKGQKDQITALVKSGDTMKAQKIILKELGSEFAGSAAAQATAGEKAKVAFGNLKESVGTALLPVLDKLEGFFVERIVPALYRFGGFLTGTVVPAVKSFAGFVQKSVIPVLKDFAGRIVDTAKNFKERFGDQIVAVVGVIRDKLEQFFEIGKTVFDFLNSNRDVVAAFAITVGVLATGIGLVTVATTLWTAALALNPIGIVVVALAALAAGLVYAYEKSDTFRKIVDETWAGIKASVGPTIAWFQTYVIPIFTVTLPTAFKVSSKIITAIWDHFGAYIVTYLKSTFGNVLTVVQGTFKVITGVFQLFSDLLTGKWGKLWDDLKQIASGVGQVITAGIKQTLATVKLAFQTAVTGIGLVWSGLKALAAAPVNFLINTIYNDGLRKMLNLIPGVDLGEASPIKFAKGGVLPGWSPGRDIHKFYSATGGALELAGGEGILIPQATRLLGGERGIAEINRRASSFATGGIFRPVKGGSITQGLHDQYTGFPAIDFGVPTGTQVASVAPGVVSRSEDIISGGVFTSYGRVMQVMHQGFESLYAHLSGRFKSVGNAVAGGSIIGASGNTGNSTGPHLHFGVKGRSPYDFLNGSTDYGKFDGGGGAISGIGHAIAGAIPDWVTSLPGKIKGLYDDVSGMAGKFGPWGEIMANAGKSAVTSALHFVEDKAKDFLKGAVSLGGGIDAGSTIQGYQTYAMNQFPRFGWGTDQFNPLVDLWNRESGWNPLAQNKSSGAYGIPQALPGSKMASAGADWRTNAATQINWGEQYIKDRYGNPAGAWAHSQAFNWYDTGGKWPTGTVGVNTSGRDEFVATTRRDERLIIDAIERLGNRMDGPVTVTIRDKDNVLLGSFRAISRDEVAQNQAHVQSSAGMTPKV